jgi:hypothetical protein
MTKELLQKTLNAEDAEDAEVRGVKNSNMHYCGHLVFLCDLPRPQRPLR